MKNLILGSSLVVLTAALASCNPTTPEVPLAAPQNILTIPDDKNVTVLWDAVDDARVTGYNVYQDGKKVNATPIAAKSQIVLQALSPRRLQFLVSNVANLSKFSVRAIGTSGEGTTSPESPSRPVVCSRYLVKGTDMGAQSQNVGLTRAATALGTATVRVNGTNIPFTGSIFQGNLPSSVAVGANLEILTADGDCLVYARDTLPEQPVVTAPAAAINVSSAVALPVAWTSVTDPDRFVVSATWLEGSGGTGWNSVDLLGTARTFSIPANTLPSNKSVKIRVYAYNDGTETFIGAFETGSRMAIRNGNETGKDITTTPAATATNPGVSWGDPHLITFDQLGYEFQSVGEYDLGFSSDNKLRVQARHQPWGSSSYVSVNTAIATQMNGQKVGLYLNPPAGQSPLRLGNTGVRTVVPATGLDLGAGFKVTLAGSSYTFSYPDGDKMVVDMAGSYINVKVYPITTRAGSMKGLLGNFDGNLSNEFIKRDGGAFPPLTTLALIQEYATSWKIPTVADSLFVYDGTEAFGGFNNASFPSATPPADPTAFAAAQAECTRAGVQPKNIDGCATDKTQTGNNDFVTGAATIQQPADVIAVTPTAKPDLIIQSATLSLGNVCRPYNTFVSGSVVVKNIGAATAAARADVGVVQLVDARDELLGAGYRGNGVGIPELAAGASATVSVNIFYPISTPEDTEGLRQYIARVDIGNWYDESVETNNRFATTLEITIPNGHCKNRVGLIHGVTTSAATAYKTGLENKGMRISLLPISGLNANSAATLATYDMLMVDTNTGNLNTWEGSSDVQNAIRTAGRPLLGIGEGGYAYLGKFGSPIGWANAWHIPTGATSFAIPSPAHPTNSGIFSIISSAGSVTVSSSNMPYLAINLPPTVASTLQLVARQPDDATHYISVLNTKPTATTGATEAIWGFDGMPSYTDNGWNALANLGWFMLP